MAKQNNGFSPLLIDSLEQKLHEIAWPIKCYWAKHYPIQVLEPNADISLAAINYQHILVHPSLVKFSDRAILAVLAHEYAHRMVSPKSIEAKRQILTQVAQALNLSDELAYLVSEPAIELLVDRSNCDIERWSESYIAGFEECFDFFIAEVENDPTFSQADSDIQTLHQLMLALRLINVSSRELPVFLKPVETQARELNQVLFQDWIGCDDAQDPHHSRKIIRFAELFLQIIPQTLLNKPERLAELSQYLRHLLQFLESLQPASEPTRSSPRYASNAKVAIKPQAHKLFDLRVTRQVTDFLLSQALQHEQRTGHWHIGHALRELDIKRSTRDTPYLMPGLTTRRALDSQRTRTLFHGDRLCLSLVVDDSGSMEGDGAKYARSLCEGINRFAGVKDFPIGLITFGSEIHLSWLPARKYGQITQALTKINGHLGGTDLLTALQELDRHQQLERDMTHAIVLTDACVSDWLSCEKMLQDKFNALFLTILVVNQDIPSELKRSAEKTHHKLKFFGINPSEPVSRSLLQEIIP